MPKTRRPAFGLRPRLLAALLLSSAVTLAVAALALLSPLEHRLRADGEATVFSAVAASRAELGDIGVDRSTGLPNYNELAGAIALLRRRAGGAQVSVLDRRLATIYAPANQDLNVPIYYAQVRQALAKNRGVHALRGNELVVAEPMRIGDGGAVYGVVLVRRLQYVSSAVAVVRSAFIDAAAAGLAIALLLGVALTTTLLRRLERLRDAARDLMRRGLDASLPLDRHRDEIGELTRAFAGMQSRLRHQEQARRSFVATASHELRTPLASLDGTLELLEDDLTAARLDLDDARERTRRAREQSRRLSHLATDLLDLSRLEADVEMRSEPVELGELCRAVAAEFEPRAREKRVKLEVLPAPTPSWADCDPGAAARIVRILLDNALDVSPERSSIRMEPSADGACAQARISDSGPGVPEDERARIFERFQRGSTTGGRSGFGLGLAIGRELAVRMGGTLELLRTPAGERGARFALRLPASSAGEQP
jgi:signal transduction histidine kinase